MPIKGEWVQFSRERVTATPEQEGVYELADEQKAIIYIHGALNLREGLLSHLDSGDTPIEQARFFRIEPTFMYTLRESEHLQLYMRQSKQMPICNQEII